MYGLIKKDLFTIKGNLKTIVIIFLVFVFMSFKGQSDLSFILPLICIMMFMSTFSYDEFNNWNAYAITLPNGRKNVVKSKYLATLVLVVISTIITSIVAIISAVIKNNVDIEVLISTIFGGAFAVLLIESIMYPLIFKYGIEKGRIGLFVGVFVITAVVGLLFKNVKITSFDFLIEILEKFWLIIIPVLAILILFISYKISEKIYLKKEF